MAQRKPAIIKVVSYTCVFPTMTTQNVCCHWRLTSLNGKHMWFSWWSGQPVAAELPVQAPTLLTICWSGPGQHWTTYLSKTPSAQVDSLSYCDTTYPLCIAQMQPSLPLHLTMPPPLPSACGFYFKNRVPVITTLCLCVKRGSVSPVAKPIQEHSVFLQFLCSRYFKCQL